MRFFIIAGSILFCSVIAYASFTVREHDTDRSKVVIVQTYANGDEFKLTRPKEEMLKIWTENLAAAQQKIDEGLAEKAEAEAWITEINGLE